MTLDALPLLMIPAGSLSNVSYPAQYLSPDIERMNWRRAWLSSLSWLMRQGQPV